MISKFTSETVDTQLGTVALLRQIGKGKSGHSFLAELNGQQVVFKRMHHEPCPYYTFTGDKVTPEVQAWQKLEKIDIPVPKLLGYNVEEQYLIKDYIDGLCGHEWLAQNTYDESIIGQLFSISDKLRTHDLNIDFFPPNFVISQGRLWYVDYETNPYRAEWSLEQWGIYYWANREGMAEYAKSGDWRGINVSADSGIPIKAPFEEIVRQWKSRFNSGNQV